MGTSMRPRMATPTRTPGAAGRSRVPVLMLHTVGEAVAEAGIRIAAAHRHSVAGAAILATPAAVVGAHGPPARRAGAAVAAAADGVAADFVAVVAVSVGR